MKKRALEGVEITTDNLQPGMYLVDLGLNWAFHPFLYNRFELDEESIQKIRAMGVQRVRVAPDQGPAAAALAPSEPTSSAEERAATAQQRRRPGGHNGDAERPARQAQELTHEARSIAQQMLDEARAGRALDVREVDQLSTELCSALSEHPDSVFIFNRIRDRDNYTYQHSVNVAVLLMAFAQHLDLPKEQARALGTAGILHDIGKTQISDEIISKAGPLTEDEFAEIKTHTWRGAEILRNTEGVTPLAVRIAEQHHERIDGGGYPYGIQGSQLDMESRMAAIVDIYDAVTAARAYKEGRPPTEGLRIILSEVGQGLDEKLAQRFVRCIGVYPPGTLVRLSSGHLAIVLQGRDKVSQPKVRIIYDTRNQRTLLAPQDVDLSEGCHAQYVARYEDAAEWGLALERFLEG